MVGKIANESTGDDILAMDVSDTNTQMVTAFRAQNPYIRFYTFNGAFTLDTTVPIPSAGDGSLINITTATYIAFFKVGDPQYKIIHEVTKEVIVLDLSPGENYRSALMVKGTQYLAVLTMPIGNWISATLFAINITDLIPCHSSCNTCAGIPTDIGCTSCAPPNFLNEGSCGPTCPLNKYQNLETNECDLCDPSCASCFSGSINGCLTCIPSRVYNGNGDCRKTCPAGKYLDVPLKTCFPCDPTCKTCQPDATTCTSCNAPLFLTGTSCVPKCPDGQFGDALDNTCKPCDLTKCLTCET